MTHKKKLQVFISSTYNDLKKERQAAVEAILAAGHIPAGMELFAAGNETQMKVIKDWIDESDVFMLIMGTRYGSIEPKTGKSYIHIEYEYAWSKKKPVFAVVIDEDYLDEWYKQRGRSVVEEKNPDKLADFRKLVCSKMVKFWKDPRDIKIAIMETMVELVKKPELVGWVPGNEVVITSPAVAEGLLNLMKENDLLKEELATLTASMSSTIAPSELYIFIKELCDAYSRIGDGEYKYIPLDYLQESLLKKYSIREFQDFLILARQNNIDKIWIDKDVDKKTNAVKTLVKIHYKSF
jgi:hypothetical protein